MLNLLSLLFGMAAWGLALFAKAKDKKAPYVSGSFLCCAVSIFGQMLELYRRALRGDFGGIEDTIGFVIAACAVLLVGTVLLNFSRPKNDIAKKDAD